MSQINDLPLAIPSGDFAVNLFALSGFRCIMLARFEVGDLKPGQVISFGGLKWWGAGSSSWQLDADHPVHTLSSGSGGLETVCCWSASGVPASSSSSSSGPAPDPPGESLVGVNSGPATTVTVRVIIGRIDDCPAWTPGGADSSGSSGDYHACSSASP